MDKEEFFGKYYKALFAFVEEMDKDDAKLTLSLLTIMFSTQCILRGISQEKLISQVERYYLEAKRLHEKVEK